jgi:hypothetical protein
MGLKRTGRIKPRNAKRRTSEFARCYRSKSYLRHIHAMPCYACGLYGETDAAHGETGGMGYKAGWETLLPLCRRCHTKQHQSGWTSLAMTSESRERAARLVRESFEEKHCDDEGFDVSL